MTDEPEQPTQTEQANKPTITADISKMSIRDMRALVKFTAGGMTPEEQAIHLPRVFDTLDNVGLGDIPIGDLREAVDAIWAAVGKSQTRSTNGS